MQKNNLLMIIAIFAFSISIAAHADMGSLSANSVVPVEWQAIKLQESIEDKIKRSLLPIIKPEEYVIEVKIGIDTEKAEDPSSKKLTKNIQSKKVKFTTAEAPKEGDDFVVFNKMGLEAPIVGDEPVETQNSEVELAQKALIEMNDRYNLFNFLTTIDINLTFDKGVSGKTKESIQKIVRGLSFNTKDVIPQINLQYIELKNAKVITDPLKSEMNANGKNEAGKDPKKELPTMSDRFKNLDIMIGLILAALLIALAMIFIAKKGSKIEEEAKNENIGEEENVNKNEVQEGEALPIDDDVVALEGDDMNIDLTQTDPVTLRIAEGIGRFKKMLNHHYNDMALMLKGWIKIGKGDEAMALKAIVQMFSDAELTEIFKCLTTDERSTWKMCLNGELNKEELSKAFHFIGNQVMQTMMVPSLIDDFEICDLLISLRAEDAAKYTEKNIELGVIFANVLSSKTISEMFKLMPVELSAEVIEQSAFFQKEDILAKMPVLKACMLEFKARRERPPFIKRIVDILPTARPQLEKKLYSTLLKQLSMEDVKDIAATVFPSDLLQSFPDAHFKEVIAKMPLEIQIQYFISLSDEEREEKMNKFASKGSKSRDMLDVEINPMLKNEILVARIRNEKREALEMEFLNYARGYLTESVEAQKEVASMLESWLQKIREEDSGSSHEDRRAA